MTTEPGDWLRSRSLDGIGPAGRRAVEIVSRVLDERQPENLDLSRSAVGIERGETSYISLAHRSGEAADLYIAIESGGWVNLYFARTHDEVYGGDFESDVWAADLHESVESMLVRQADQPTRRDRVGKSGDS